MITKPPRPSPKEIIIIGGSLGSLFAGTVLLSYGHRVTILERSPSHAISSQGAGISVSPIVPEIVELLKNLGTSGSPVIDFFEKYDRTNTPYYGKGDGVQYLDKEGKVKEKIGSDVLLGACSWDLVYNVLRAGFDGGYEECYVPPMGDVNESGRAQYINGILVTGIEEDEESGKVIVRFEADGEDGENEIEADLVIAADGASSFVRRALDPENERRYAGYVCFRGTAREDLLEEETMDLFGDCVTVFHTRRMQSLTYKIPGNHGKFETGSFLQNIEWYINLSPPDLQKVLTDTTNYTHRFSLGVGRIHPEIKSEYQTLAKKVLPPPLNELFQKIDHPFIQAVTDNLATKAVFMGGKVILVGDAVAGCRPHTTAGTTQAAMHALLLGKVFGEGTMGLDEWERLILEYARKVQEIGARMGNLNQFGDHPMNDDK